MEKLMLGDIFFLWYIDLLEEKNGDFWKDSGEKFIIF